MRKSKFYILISLFFLFGCSEKIQIGSDVRDQFYLEVDDAILPVIVRGNTASNTFMIMMHGGPGGHTAIYEELRVLSGIEEESAVVYWDQRCSGASQGNCQVQGLEMEDFLSDIDILIDLLQQRYGDDIGIFLMGHSWGGALTVNYVINEERASRLKGCLVVDGIHNFTNYVTELQSMVDSIGGRQIGLGENVDTWQEHISDLAELKESNTDDALTANRIGNQLESLILDSLTNELSSPGDLINYYLFSNFDYFMTTVNNIVANQGVVEELANLNLTSQLSKIDLPIAVYVGQFDFVTPPFYAFELAEEVSSEEVDLEVFKTSGHSPMINETTKFNSKSTDFIIKYR